MGAGPALFCPSWPPRAGTLELYLAHFHTSHLSEYANFQEKPFEVLWDDIFGLTEAYLQRAPVTVTY